MAWHMAHAQKNLHISRNCKSVINPIEDGNDPTSLLSQRYSPVNIDNEPIASGILPVSKLDAASNLVICEDNNTNSVGIVPVKSLYAVHIRTVTN